MNTPTPKQLNEELHYYDRLANLQMSDSLNEKKEQKEKTKEDREREYNENEPWLDEERLRTLLIH